MSGKIHPAGNGDVPALDHGATGNGRVISLVSPSGAVEWLCMPRFDSPSVFGRLLDRDKGGTFVFLFGGREVRGRQAYVPNTNVLRTEFAGAAGSWELIDFAPRIPDGLGVRVPVEIVRLIRPLSGTPRLSVVYDPRPDYARTSPSLVGGDSTVLLDGSRDPFVLTTNLPVEYLLNRLEFTLDRPLFFRLAYGTPDGISSLQDVERSLDLTVAGWQAWAKTCAVPTFAPAEVLRSALCLKLHACHDTGAIIAAATTSIPEALGTGRTWDYRYCWLRDAAFVVEALRRLSHLHEGEQFIRYLRNVAESGPLQPLYGLGGERDLLEDQLAHLVGFGGSGPVRTGNAASHQRQNDLMGEMILCLETLLTDVRVVIPDREAFFPLIEKLVEQAIRDASTLDTGIWEFRSLLRPYTFSRAMCWAAISRGAVLARAFGRTGLAARWETIAAAERETVLTRGFSEKHGFFTQALDGQFPDASNLLLPTIGIVDATDPRFVRTVKAYEQELVVNGLMLRYRNPDDFGETSSAFTICSFWWVEALALTGRLDEAVELFNRLLTYTNPVGLFSEDIDPATGRLLGNFPQAYTHVGLIHAAMTIGELLEARNGKVRAWT